MDIEHWLEGVIVDAEQTKNGQPDDLIERLGLPAFFYPRANEVSSNHRKRQSKRKRSSSDTSFLDPYQPDRDTHTWTTPCRSRVGNAVASSASTRTSRSSTLSVVTDRSSGRYRRRTRHKTRPERYEISTAKTREKERKRRQKERDGKKRKRRKEKDKRHEPRKDNKCNVGIVQSFRPKNITKARRLTLRPQENLGLFSKGRSSSLGVQGKGLPDLSFPNLSFLQTDNTTQQKHTHGDSKRAKKTRAQTEEEISTFFIPRRAALAERDGNIHARPDSSPLHGSIPEKNGNEPCVGADSDIQVTKLPDNLMQGHGHCDNCHCSSSRILGSKIEHRSDGAKVSGAFSTERPRSSHIRSSRDINDPCDRSAFDTQSVRLEKNSKQEPEATKSSLPQEKAKVFGVDQKIRPAILPPPPSPDTLLTTQQESSKKQLGAKTPGKKAPIANATEMASICGQTNTPNNESSLREAEAADGSQNSLLHNEPNLPVESPSSSSLSSLRRLLHECDSALETDVFRHHPLQDLQGLGTAAHQTKMQMDEGPPLTAFQVSTSSRQSSTGGFVPFSGELGLYVEQAMREAEFQSTSSVQEGLLSSDMINEFPVDYDLLKDIMSDCASLSNESLNRLEDEDGMVEDFDGNEGMGYGAEGDLPGFWRPHRLY